MKIHPLPPGVALLLTTLDAPPRLIAHLALVHDVAVTLTKSVSAAWPMLQYDASAVLFGAATHDIGKTRHPEELFGSGNRHEIVGEELLQVQGYAPELARFAHSHGQWATIPVVLEDLLVALADTIWKGKRSDLLEEKTVQLIVDASGEDTWQVWNTLDGILEGLSASADYRLQWQVRGEN